MSRDLIKEADTADVLAGENRVWRYYFAQLLGNSAVTFAAADIPEQLERLAKRADLALEITKRRGRLAAGVTPAVPEP